MTHPNKSLWIIRYRLFYQKLYYSFSYLHNGSVARQDAGTNEGGTIATNGTTSLFAIRGIYSNLRSVINTFHLQDTTFTLYQYTKGTVPFVYFCVLYFGGL